MCVCVHKVCRNRQIHQYNNKYIEFKNKPMLDFAGGPFVKMDLPTQGTWIRSLVPEDSTCHWAAEPVQHNY